jgi:hypothetical protein
MTLTSSVPNTRAVYTTDSGTKLRMALIDAMSQDGGILASMTYEVA